MPTLAPCWSLPPAQARPSRAAQVIRVLVDKVTGQPRSGVDAKQLLAAVRARKHVVLPPQSLLLPAPLTELGEHALPLRFDEKHIPGNEHTLTVLIKKKI